MMSVREIDMERFRDQIRLLTLKQLHHLGFGHYGGSLSIADVLAVLYGKVMKIDPANPSWEDRDFFILSKGTAAPPYMQRFIFPAILKKMCSIR